MIKITRQQTIPHAVTKECCKSINSIADVENLNRKRKSNERVTLYSFKKIL